MSARRLPHRFGLHLWVGAGAVLGGLARLFVSRLFAAGLGLPEEAGTLVANLTGSFAIGLWAALTGPEGRLLVGTRQRQLVTTGICGGYTTFSLLSLETTTFLRDGAPATAVAYAAASFLGAMLAVWAGYGLGERLNRPRRRRRAPGRT